MEKIYKESIRYFNKKEKLLWESVRKITKISLLCMIIPEEFRVDQER
jgi:hypothetical protein